MSDAGTHALVNTLRRRAAGIDLSERWGGYRPPPEPPRSFEEFARDALHVDPETAQAAATAGPVLVDMAELRAIDRQLAEARETDLEVWQPEPEPESRLRIPRPSVEEHLHRIGAEESMDAELTDDDLDDGALP